MKTRKVKLAALRKVDGNVRKHSERQIREYMRSVQAYGQLKPLVVDESGTILIGNGLYDALTGLGWTDAQPAAWNWIRNTWTPSSTDGKP